MYKHSFDTIVGDLIVYEILIQYAEQSQMTLQLIEGI